MSVEKIWLKAGVLVVVVIGVIVYLFSPKPIVQEPENAYITVILVRMADDDGTPYKHVENFDEQAILNVLHEARQRQTLYNYLNAADIDLIVSLTEDGKGYEVNLGKDSFIFYSKGNFRHRVLGWEEVLNDITALLDPEELKGTVLEQK